MPFTLRSVAPYLSITLVMLAASAPSTAHADDDDPLPPPPAPPAAARPEPRAAVDSDRRRTDEEQPIDRLTGTMGIGTTILFRTEEAAFFAGNVGLTRWFRNIGIGAAAGWALNGSSYVLSGDVGVRLLGSSGKSGPFVGGGFGIRGFDLDDRRMGGFRGNAFGAGAYVEVGVIVRGLVTGSLRGDLPFFGIDGTQVGSRELFTTTRLVPIGLTAQIGFLF